MTASSVYDVALPVGPQHRVIAPTVIRSLSLFTKARRIRVLAAPSTAQFLAANLGADIPVSFIDEGTVIPDVTLEAIQAYFERRIGRKERAGWYFQQFLKMEVARLPDIPGFYLIWDSDTVALRPLDFFADGGAVLINPKNEHHRAYFQWTERVLGLRKAVGYSFISEHLMVNTRCMNELLDAIGRADRRSWVWTILDNIDDDELGWSGFSEYETYGSFLANRYPGSYRCRPLKTLRRGTRRFGTCPTRHDLFRLMCRGYDTVTCERWHTALAPRVAFNRALSKGFYAGSALVTKLTGRSSTSLARANALQPDHESNLKGRSTGSAV